MTPAAAPARTADQIQVTAPIAAAPRKDRRWLAAVALLGWISTGVYVVRADQQAVVTRFGRVVEPRVMPGLHLALPWPVDRVTRLKVRQLQRTVIGGDVADSVLGRTDPLRSQFLTGDQNLIHMRTVVQYSVGVPVDYLFRTENVETLIGAVVEAELARAAARMGVDDILTTGKAHLQEIVRASAQKSLNDLRAGVLIASVNVENVVPPAEAADAFRDVASARADSSRIVNNSQGYLNDVVPRARGEAQQMIQAAHGHRQRVINQALGDTERFRQVAAEHERASEVNGRRLYVETLEQILPRIRKVFVDRNGNLDLTIFGRGAPDGARK
ncbi:MAG TPA: FtsH protease activity modulator HflK [Bryobacteraceae bacterium]|nr:FtsH protease activity modulator HflK [Bryobacteraceae bacterium]